MSKPIKIALLLVSLWPFLYVILFFIFFISTAFYIGASDGKGADLPIGFAIIFCLHVLTMLLIMALTVFYMVNVFRNDRVEKDKKVLWAVVLFMGNMIAMPIYWYLYIWKEPAVAPLPLRSAPGGNAMDQQDFTRSREMPNWRE